MNDPSASPKPPPKKRPGCLRRLVARLFQTSVLLVLAVLALIVGWVRSDDFRNRAVKLVETVLEGQLGEEVTLNDVRIRFWPPGVDAYGLHVFHAPTGDTILSAERVRIPVVLRDGGVGIGQLALQSPAVMLHVEKDGKLREFRNLKKAENPKPLKRLPWASLRVNDGLVHVDFADDLGFVEVDDIDLLPTRGPKSDLTAQLRYRIKGLGDSSSLTLPDLVLGPDVIEIPDFTLDTRVLDVHGRATIPLQGEVSSEVSLRADLEEINPALTPPRAAHGFVDADLVVRGTPKDPTAWVSVSGAQLGLDVPGVFTPLLTYELGELMASAVVRKDGIRIEQAVVPWADGRIVAWGTITPDKRLVDGHVTMDDTRLLPLLQAFDAAPTPWVDFRGDAEIACEGTLNPLRIEGDFEFGVAQLHVGDRPLESRGVELLLDIPHAHAKGNLVLEKDHIFLEAPDVRGPRSGGSMTVDIGFGPKGPLDLRFDLDRADLSDFKPLADVGLKGTGRVSGRIAGPFNQLEFTGDGDVRDFEVLGIHYADHLVADLHSPRLKSIELIGARAELDDSTYGGRYAIDFRSPISMDTAITVDKGRVEDMVHMFVGLDGLKGDLTGTLWLKGPLFDMDGQADLFFRDAEIYGEHFPTGEAHGYMDQGLFTLDDLRVRREGGQTGLTLRGSVERKWKLDMELIADGFDLATLDRLMPYELPMKGKLAAHARITNTLFDPSPEGRITLTGLTYEDTHADDSVIRVTSEGGVAHYVGDLLGGTARVDGTLGLWGEQPYALTADLRKLPAHLFYPVGADGSPITALVSGKMDVSGHFGEAWSPVTLRSQLDDVAVKYGKHDLHNQVPWIYDQDGNSFRAQDIGLAGGDTDLRLSAEGGDALAVSGQGVVDIDLLRAVVPGLQKANGVAVVDLHVEGSRPNVEAVVEVDVAADLLRHSSAPLAFEDTRAHLEIREDRIDLLSVEGGLGGGTFSGSGTIDARDWIPTRYDLGMSVRDAEVQWVESLPPAIGDGDFRFDGPVGALLMSGDIEVSDMTFADRIDWEDWVVEYRDEMLVDPATTYDEEPLFSLNVHIAADRSIFLRNNVAEGVASADLRIIGDTVRPGLVGTVTVDEGLVFLQDREFRIDRAVLLWNDPWSWDPQLDFSLLTDIANQDQQYRVDYQVVGPFSDWHTVTRSDPPLPQADVNALLWFGMTTDQLEELGELSSAVAQSMADLIVTDFFVSGQAGELGTQIPELLFDRIDLATGVNARGQYSPDPRLLIEKRLDDLGQVDLKWELNLVHPEDSYVAASRKIGGIWSLSGWYATQQRDRVLPIGGAYGVDVLARWELE
ncbi:MAG: translocation/assembly module TamB domain-containing protein [Alphaproteobacteria bacterium]|nr:translocation/assembly module TamB domain-containing protein [Alphaproteobacteria bacterium]MCB9697877.1 translocation/assembly module TamB domain-containing protein [Alphaproteobacteria bacterium]